ncbi:MAG: type II toxin-antitoxin system death-on-curing family toxin [Bacteroidota bacterium]|nr:type II toxin-antitoxin system death-on-curing family toxin [Bacteroidota bacterium]
MISIDFVLIIHDNLIENHGGSKGVRDQNLLESAINRPFATFDGTDLYEDGIKKASAIFESVLINHPFVDGNKRTAFALMVFMLSVHNLELNIDETTLYDFIISATKGEKDFDNIESWLRSNTIKK